MEKYGLGSGKPVVLGLLVGLCLSLGGFFYWEQQAWIRLVLCRPDYFMSANLAHIELKGISVKKINFRNRDVLISDLSKCNLSGVDLSYANLTWVNLNGSVLRRANLSHANLIMADLANSDLREVNLSYADLRGALLERTNLAGSNLSGAQLEQVNLTNALYNDQTRWPEGFTPPPEAIKEE